MTTFLQAVKLLYYYDNNPIYWDTVMDSLWAEFCVDNPAARSPAAKVYVKDTYGVELNYEDPVSKSIVFDSEQSKLLFALRFPGLE
jgi:hypothetical protein